MSNVIDAKGRFNNRQLSYEVAIKVPIEARVKAIRGALELIEAERPLGPALACIMHNAKALRVVLDELSKEVA